MIAITIAVVLGLGMVQVFSAQRAAFSANESLARIQENSRFALSFLERDIRMTGNMTCLNDIGFQGRLYNHLSPSGPDAAPWLYRIDQPLQVFEFTGTAPGDGYALPEERTAPGGASWDPPLAPDLGIDDVALDGSDVIVSRYMSAESTLLTGIGINGAADTLTVADPGFLSGGRVYGVTDCRNFSLFQSLGGDAIGIGKLNLVGWSGRENSYGPDVPLHRFEFVAYYVALGGDGGPALFRKSFNHAGELEAEELVSGVESLQAVLGADTTLRAAGDRPTNYVTAAAVDAGGGVWPASTTTQRWNSVVSVRLVLLMRNESRAALPAPGVSYRVADTRLQAQDDARLRHAYEVQIALRNRIRG